MKTIATDLINLIQNGVKPEAIDAVITIENGEVTACGVFVDFKENKPEPEKPTGQTNKTKGIHLIDVPNNRKCAAMISDHIQIGISRAYNFTMDKFLPKTEFKGSEKNKSEEMRRLSNKLSAIGVLYQLCN